MFEEKELLEELVVILELYKNAIEKLESSQKITISLVIPELIKLKHQLVKLKDSSLHTFGFVTNLLEDFDLRFGHILSVNHPKFCNLYVLGTLLNPMTSSYLKAKKEETLKQLSEYAYELVGNLTRTTIKTHNTIDPFFDQF